MYDHYFCILIIARAAKETFLRQVWAFLFFHFTCKRVICTRVDIFR